MRSSFFHVAVFEGVAEMSSRYSALAMEEAGVPTSGSRQASSPADVDVFTDEASVKNALAALEKERKRRVRAAARLL